MLVNVASRLGETPLLRTDATSPAEAVKKCMKITIVLYGITDTSPARSQTNIFIWSVSSLQQITWTY